MTSTLPVSCKMIRFRLVLGILLALFLAGCSTAPTAQFLHIRHRRDFAFDVEELKEAGFYLTQNVLARNISVGEEIAGNRRVVLVTGEEMGRVVDGGPDWLRVSFGRGSGIIFMTRGEDGDQEYYLATEVEGQPGFHMVKDLAEKIVLYESERFEITFGSHASLLIDSDDLRDLMSTRSIRLWTEDR